MDGNTNSRAEAERLLGIAEKLLQTKDFEGAREFAILAQETEPLLDGSDQILAVADVILAAAKRINNQHDWYAVLQLHRSDDLDLIKRQYRRLALLLHPDKNKFAFADSAFRIVADAWSVLSDSAKKSLFDSELAFFTKVDLRNQRDQQQNQFRREQDDQQQQQKLPVRRSGAAGNSGGVRASTSGGGGGGDETKAASFWTACPYCYNLYEYPKGYEECCLRCQNCQRAFHAAVIPSLPPVAPGKEEYYCCWAFFPLGFAKSNSESGKKAAFPNPTPPKFPTPFRSGSGADDFVDLSHTIVTPAVKKRGRPKKNLQA